MRLCFLYSNQHLARITAQPGVAFKLAQVARRSGHEVLIVSNSPVLDIQPPAGIQMCLAPGLGNIQTYLASWRQWFSAIKSFNPDVIHVHGNMFFLLMFLLKPFLGRPLSIYVSETVEIHSGLTKILFLFSLKRAGIIFSSSNYIRKQLIASGLSAGQIQVVRLGLSQEFLRIPRPVKPSVDVLYFGDGTWSRGFDLVVGAASRLPQYKFVCLLRYQETDCKEAVFAAQTSSNLQLRYFPYRQRMADLLAGAKVILLPFRFMGVRPPLTMVEAMAVGAVVVTSNLEGNEELIKNGKNGYILTRLTSEAIKSTLVRLLKTDKRARAIGSQARKDVAEMYTAKQYKVMLTSLAKLAAGKL